MATCAVCDLAIADGLGLADDASGTLFHPACAVARLPHDAAGLAFAAATLVAAPLLRVWSS